MPRPKKAPTRVRKTWSYTAGVRGLNRVTVYERWEDGPLQIEWFDRAGRHRESLQKFAGHPITDKEAAIKIADALSDAQKRKREGATVKQLLGVKEFPTLQQLLDTLHAQKHDGWSVSYRRTQANKKEFWLKAFKPGTPLNEFPPALVEERARVAARANKWTPRTEASYLVYLRDAFYYAQNKLKWIGEEHNLSALTMPKGDVDNAAITYTEQEMMLLLPACWERDLRLAAVAEVAYATQRRLDAIRTLPVTAYGRRLIDGEAFGVINFPGESDKAGKTSMAVLTEDAQRAVELLLQRPAVRASGLMFPAGELDAEKGPFTTQAAKTLNTWLHEAEVSAGVATVKGRAFHGMKRGAVTLAADETGDIALVGQQSGTTSATLEKVYRQGSLRGKVKVARALDNVKRRKQ